MKRYILLLLVLALFKTGAGTVYYLSPTGSDTYNGTSPDTPLRMPDKAIAKVVAGDTILVRGGTYSISSTLYLKQSGTPEKKIHLLAWPGESPIFDFSGTASGKRGISLTGSHWVIRGLFITKAGDNGMHISGGAFNLVENCNFSENEDTGLQLSGGAHDNQIINCDSWYNADPPDYGDADGFAPKMDVGTNNYFYGCRAWQNCDDGWDGYLRNGNNASTILENCWTWRNGYLKDGRDPGSQANGNGFKMGGSDDKTLKHHFIVKNCLAFDNKSKGFDQNNNKGAMTIFNGTAFRNKGNDFSIPSALPAGEQAIVKNSLAAQGNKISLGTFVIQQANSWNGGVTVTAADFISLDTTGVSGPRKADGSLPELPFMKLAAGSDLIDAGIDIGLPFLGPKPDLGCFEREATTHAKFPLASLENGYDLKLLKADRSFADFSFTPGDAPLIHASLVTMQGTRVWQSQIRTSGAARAHARIDRSSFPSGIYLLNLYSSQNRETLKIQLP